MVLFRDRAFPQADTICRSNRTLTESVSISAKNLTREQADHSILPQTLGMSRFTSPRSQEFITLNASMFTITLRTSRLESTGWLNSNHGEPTRAPWCSSLVPQEILTQSIPLKPLLFRLQSRLAKWWDGDSTSSTLSRDGTQKRTTLTTSNGKAKLLKKSNTIEILSIRVVVLPSE